MGCRSVRNMDPLSASDGRSHTRDLSVLVLQRPDLQVQGLPCLLQIFLNMEISGQRHCAGDVWHPGSQVEDITPSPEHKFPFP